MPNLQCTEPVCRHAWSETPDPEMPRCPRCGGFWVRVTGMNGARPRTRRRNGRMLARRTPVR